MALNRMHYIFIDIRRRPCPQPLLTRSRPKNFKTRGFVSRLGISRRCSGRSIPAAQREFLPRARSDSAAFAAIRSIVIHRDYGEPRRRCDGFRSSSHTRNQRHRDVMKHRMIREGGGGALTTRSCFALPRARVELRFVNPARNERDSQSPSMNFNFSNKCMYIYIYIYMRAHARTHARARTHTHTSVHIHMLGFEIFS